MLLERGEVANSWRTERWDSLRLLTPNWQSRLPGFAYEGDDPDGFMSMPEVVAFLQAMPSVACTGASRHARDARQPVDGGYESRPVAEPGSAATLVIASGACNIAAVPALSAGCRDRGQPHAYAVPQSALLPEGGVMIVGASATGVQLAREIRASGRHVMLSVGEHVRLPRIYRGHDIQWWMDVIGAMDVRYDEIDDLDRARHLPSLQLVGTPERATIDLNSLRQAGVEIVGRLVGLATARRSSRDRSRTLRAGRSEDEPPSRASMTGWKRRA